jgi:uncharacterized protein (TIGR02145 family)
MKRKAITFILLTIMLVPVTAWAGLTKTQVSQLYVSIFGRASEGGGNSYWQALSDMVTAANTMLDTQAAKDYFGANLNTNQAFIEHIYLNTLNKTIADDPSGISYWVSLLDSGTTRGEAVASLVGVIKEYAPGAQYYNPDDAATIAAYNQFTNRVEVSDYMADNVWDTPEDWQTSTSFSDGLVVTDDPATAYAAIVVVNGFLDDPFFGTCGAYIAPGVWKEFDCYNLAAIGKTTDDDPFIPSWRLIGGYWQWGRKGPDPSKWYDTNTPNFTHGPTGPDLDDANTGAISGWDTSRASNGSWSDSNKTGSDPCPAGFRLPTRSNWDGVLNNNIQSTVGTWSSSTTNYSSARFFGDDLMLPAAGTRYWQDGSLSKNRGSEGRYWSSTENTSLWAWRLQFDSGSAVTDYNSRYYCFSVRCIEAKDFFEDFDTLTEWNDVLRKYPNLFDASQHRTGEDPKASYDPGPNDPSGYQVIHKPGVGNVLKIETAAGKNDRPKLMTQETRSEGVFEWRVFVPDNLYETNGEAANTSISAWLYDTKNCTVDGCKEIDFEIGWGPRNDRSHKNLNDQSSKVLIYMQVQQPFLPEAVSSQDRLKFDAIESNQWYTLKIRLKSNPKDQGYTIEWYYKKEGDEYQSKPAFSFTTPDNYGPSNSDFHMACSVENFSDTWLGLNNPPKQNHIGLFDFIRFCEE